MKTFLLAGVSLAFLMPAPAGATTLNEALILAYQGSPVLEGFRARVRATDEYVPQARAQMRPSVSLGATTTASVNTLFPDQLTETWRAGLNANLVLFDGGQTPAAIESAKAGVLQAQESLVVTEQQVLLSAASAFLDVRRDMEFVRLAENNVKVLTEQLQSANDRFQVGELTRTDVSQTEARLAASQASLSASQGALAISTQVYLAVVGIAPQDLQLPPSLPGLPATLAEAQAIAMNEHPAIAAARYAQDGAEFDLQRAEGASGFNVSLGAEAGFQGSDLVLDEAVGGLNVTLSGSIPLYQGGALDSIVRQSQAILEQRQFELQDTARQVKQNVATAWASLGVARASINARQLQIDAAEVAFKGVQVEAELGARTQQDVLNSEQELLFARSNLVAALRDEYVAAYSLLATMGRMTVKDLALGIPTYDPTVYYDAVQNGPVEGFDGAVVDRIGHRWGQ